MILNKDGKPIINSVNNSPKLVGHSIYNPPSRSRQTDNYTPYYPSDQSWNMSADYTQGQQKTSGLYFENAIAAGIIDSMVDGTIGGGLSLESNINYKVLGLKAEDVKEIQQKIEGYWETWAKNPIMCHVQKKLSFGSLQREAYANALSAGDMLQHIKISRPFGKKGSAYPQLQNIAGQSIMSPNLSDSKTIKGGVECNAIGCETAYHVSVGDGGPYNFKTQRVTRYGARSGRLQYNLVAFGDVIPGQRRGRSVLLRVANQLIQIDRYTEAEIVKAVIQSNITLFLEKDKDTDVSGANDPMENLRENSDIWNNSNVNGSNTNVAVPEETKEQQISLGPGFIWDLPAGVKPTLPESKSPVTQFWTFLEAQLKIVSMGVGIPFEVLLKCFNSNYSASQAAIQSAARGWKIATDEFAYKYNQPVYEQFVEMLVRQGKIECKDFFTDDIKRLAWCSTIWKGPAMLNIDPVKNVKAAILSIEAGLTTREIEAKKLGDNKFDAVIEKLSTENRRMDELGIPKYTSKILLDSLDSNETDEDEDKDEEKENTENTENENTDENGGSK
jgi:lambda family phage portal protein